MIASSILLRVCCCTQTWPAMVECSKMMHTCFFTALCVLCSYKPAHC